MEDDACRAAEKVDRALARGEVKLRLLGVPFAGKDMTPTERVPATAATWITGEAPATERALAVRRLQASGATATRRC